MKRLPLRDQLRTVLQAGHTECDFAMLTETGRDRGRYQLEPENSDVDDGLKKKTA